MGTVQDRIKKLGLWQLYCLIPGVVVNVLRFVQPNPSNPDRRLALEVFRLGLVLIGLTITGVFELRKHQLKKGLGPRQPSV